LETIKEHGHPCNLCLDKRAGMLLKCKVCTLLKWMRVKQSRSVVGKSHAQVNNYQLLNKSAVPCY